MRVADMGLASSLVMLGNVPGEDAGDVLVIAPGGAQFTVPSKDVVLYAEGLRAHLPDGRGLFIHISSAVVIDAPVPGDVPG